MRACYKARHTPIFENLRLLSGQGQQRHREVEQLYKLLCKLGKVVAVSKRLLETAVMLPQDFVEGFMIRPVPSSTFEKMPMKTRETTIQSIVRRMFSSSKDQNEFLDRLEFLRMGEDLSKVIREECRKKTRVHAELLLIEYFDTYGCTFLDGNDKYIGCSKPACYLCHAYIDAHPGRYALPASHQKIYLAWRLPDVYFGDPNPEGRLETHEQILGRMIDKVRQDLKTEIESRTPQRSFHADSTAGLTSTAQRQHQYGTSYMGDSRKPESTEQNGMLP